jgi:hypothetical protein
MTAKSLYRTLIRRGSGADRLVDYLVKIWPSPGHKSERATSISRSAPQP